MEQIIITLIQTSPWYIFFFLIYKAATTVYKDCGGLFNTGITREITKLVTARVASENGNANIILSMQDIITDVLASVKELSRRH